MASVTPVNDEALGLLFVWILAQLSLSEFLMHSSVPVIRRHYPPKTQPTVGTFSFPTLTLHIVIDQFQQ